MRIGQENNYFPDRFGKYPALSIFDFLHTLLLNQTIFEFGYFLYYACN